MCYQVHIPSRHLAQNQKGNKTSFLFERTNKGFYKQTIRPHPGCSKTIQDNISCQVSQGILFFCQFFFVRLGNFLCDALLYEKDVQRSEKSQESKKFFQGSLVQHIVRSYSRIQTVITIKALLKV